MTTRRERLKIDPTRTRAARARTLRRKTERAAKLRRHEFSMAAAR